MSFSEWKEVKLGDACTKIGSGVTPRGGDKAYKKTGVSLIRSQNIYDFNFDYNGLVFIDDEQANKMKNVELLSDDILLNITGDSVARCTMVPEKTLPARVNQHVSIIRPSKEIINPKYLLYCLNNYTTKELLLSLASTGATRKALTKSMIENLTLTIPSIKEQKAIADTLSCIDNKIELNSRMNKTLEEIAQAIFKSWFVDFEPFQDGEFDDSEFGRIPKGWRVDSVYEICDVIYGAAFKSKLFNEDKIGFPLIRIRDLKTFSPQFYTDEKHPKAELVQLGDILVGMDAEFRPCIWKGNVGVLNQRVCKFAPKHDYVSKYFIYSIIKPHMEFIENFKVGTTVSHIGKNDIDKIKILIPTIDVLMDFKAIVKPLFDSILSNSVENQTLTAIRDALLPKLMSGEIRVPTEEVK